MSLLEHEAQTLSAFKSNVEDLALVELNRLEAEQKVLSEALASVHDSIKSVKAVLRGVTVNGHKPKLKSKAQVPFSMSQDREGEVIRWLTGNKDEITSRTIKVQFPGWSESYCNMTLKFLRETGVLRLSGTAGSMNIYRSLI